MIKKLRVWTIKLILGACSIFGLIDQFIKLDLSYLTCTIKQINAFDFYRFMLLF